MVPVADCLCLSFLLGRCENSKNILTSLIPQILTAAPAERSFFEKAFFLHILSLSQSSSLIPTMILATSRFLEVQYSEWRAVSSCPWKGNGDECWMIAKLHDNYSIHYFRNRMGKTAWELGGYWELEITFICSMCVCVSVCANQVLLCTYTGLRTLSPHAHS